ncbi:hypothetical protein [Novispirillum itersonii]|uniref:hypothetical protein n=1 Tax=Novispirillum itersonii TaxID=189 RepID=UPI0003646577|nr:hypothetical protein [Novispirillum itersonii]
MTSSPPEDKPFHALKIPLRDVHEAATPSPEIKLAELETGEDSRKTFKYDDRTVAFIDILGFKEHIKASERDPDLVTKIYYALSFETPSLSLAENFAKRLDLKPGTLKDITHSFSDCIAILTGTTPEEIGLLIFIVWQKSRELLLNGFISRGGISIGKLYHDDSRLFGPAFNKAFQLESTHAGGARVILDTKTRQLIECYKAEHEGTLLKQFFNTYVRRANDGPAYVDLFGDIRSPGFSKDQPVPTEDIAKISKVISAELDKSSDTPHHFQKITFLARAFNEALGVGGRPYYIRRDTFPDAILPPVSFDYIA